MTPAQIYQTARNAGFPPDTAVKMTAIAMRESSGNPSAYNGNAGTGDNSYGLWQVNMIGTLGQARLQQFGLSDPSQLFDPDTNAKAAYAIWAGNDDNLNRAWYINRPGYQEKYESFLPAAEAAAYTVDAWTDTAITDSVSSGVSSVTAWIEEAPIEQKAGVMIAAAAALGFVWSRM